jgi:prepilin-type N-terminal cleavage/methylation domain-containing protein
MKTRHQNGFTIVELLVIIVVMGILLSLTVFAYGDWRLRTAKNEVQSNLIQLRSAMENARNFDNAYPSTVPTSYDASSTVTITLTGGGAAYCAVGTSTARTTVVYYISLPNTPDPTTTKPAGCP